MTLKPKNAQDASEHIVKLLNPGVPYPMQSTGAQSVLAYMKLRDEAIATALLTALEGIIIEGIDDEPYIKGRNAGIRASRAIITNLLTPTV